MATLLATQTTGLAIEITHLLSGPNAWSRRSVMEFRLETEVPTSAIRREADELLASLGLEAIGPTELEGVEALAEWLSAAAIALQLAAGTPVSFSAWQRTDGDAAIRVAVEYEEASIAQLAIETLQRWLCRLLLREHFTVCEEWSRLLEMTYDMRIGNTTRTIVAAAEERGIPFLRLDEESLVQLGQGRHQRRISKATTDRTGMIANNLATDKQRTKLLLRELGIPVPHGRHVLDADDACRAAKEFGWPIVVKPRDADYGNGVSIRVTTPEQVRTAYDTARCYSEHVLVERFVPGTLFRLLVVDGRLVAAVRREAPYVIGDGRQTILELVNEANYDPHRPREYVSPLNCTGTAKSELPSLAASGLPNDTVPTAGQTVQLRGDVYMRNGGIQVDRTHHVHPEIATLAIDAARVVGLDIAGLDVIAQDIAVSPQEQEFAILEVNPEPAILLHMAPLCEPPRPVAEAIVETLFPRGKTGRIPLIAVLGNPGDYEWAERIVSECGREGQSVGFANRDGAWLAGRRLGTRSTRLGDHVRRLWRHPRTELVVVQLSLADILHEGAPFERCDQLIELEDHSDPERELLEFSESDLQRALDRLRETVERMGCEAVGATNAVR